MLLIRTNIQYIYSVITSAIQNLQRLPEERLAKIQTLNHFARPNVLVLACLKSGVMMLNPYAAPDFDKLDTQKHVRDIVSNTLGHGSSTLWATTANDMPSGVYFPVSDPRSQSERGPLRVGFQTSPH